MIMASPIQDTQTQEPKTKQLFIQLSGPPGAGKSTMANLLRHPTAAIVLDHDIIRSALLPSSPPSSSEHSSRDEDALTFEQAAKSAYNVNWALADSLLRQGHSLIVDSTCNYDKVLDRGVDLARRHGCEYWYVECRVTDVALLDARLRARQGRMRSQRAAVDEAPPDATSAQYRDARARFMRWIDSPARPGAREGVNCVTVDSTGSPEERRDEILARIFATG